MPLEGERHRAGGLVERDPLEAVRLGGLDLAQKATRERLVNLDLLAFGRDVLSRILGVLLEDVPNRLDRSIDHHTTCGKRHGTTLLVSGRLRPQRLPSGLG